MLYRNVLASRRTCELPVCLPRRADFDLRKLLDGGRPYRSVEFWDVGGNPEAAPARRMFYEDSSISGVLLVYDVTNPRRAFLRWLKNERIGSPDTAIHIFCSMTVVLFVLVHVGTSNQSMPSCPELKVGTVGNIVLDKSPGGLSSPLVSRLWSEKSRDTSPF